MDKLKLDKFLVKMFKLYNFIPYHNFAHAVQVMMIFKYMINQYESVKQLFTTEEMFLY